MKILFDTNVLIAAFISGGSSYDVIEQAIHEHDIYCSTFIINEFRRVFKSKFHYPEPLINEFVRFINKFFIKGDTGDVIDNICRDPDDGQILADALLNKINIIITGDKDLLDLKSYRGIKVISPKEYWSL